MRTYPPPKSPQGVGPRPSPSIDWEGIGVALLASFEKPLVYFQAIRALLQAIFYWLTEDSKGDNQKIHTGLSNSNLFIVKVNNE